MKTKKHTLKQILSFYKPYKGLFAADLLCSLIAAAIGLVLPLGAGYITDKVLTGDLSWGWGRCCWAWCSRTWLFSPAR